MAKTAVSPFLLRWVAAAVSRRFGIEAPRAAAAMSAAILAIALAASGGTARLDASLSDAWIASAQRKPTGEIVIVDVTRAAADAGDMLHLPRTRLAQLLRIFAAAGVRRTLIDLNLSGAITSEGDTELESAVAALTPERVALIASAVVTSDPRGIVHWQRTEVLARFARHAETVSSDLAFDGDGQLRRFGIVGANLPQLPSGADWLANGSTMKETRSRRLDFGIDRSQIRVVDAADLAAGRADVSQLKERLVLVASFATGLGNAIRVPRFGSMRRADITALAAETMLQRRMLQEASGNAAMLAVAFLAVGMVLWAGRLGSLLAAGAVLGCCLCIIGLAAQLQLRYGLTVPTVLLMASVVLGYLVAAIARHPAVTSGRGIKKDVDLRLADVMGEGGEAVVTFAQNGQVLSMNAAARHLFAHARMTSDTSVADLIGSNADELLNATRARQPGRIAAVIDGDGGALRHLDLTVSSVQAGGERWIGVASIRDMTDQQAQIAELRRMVVHDPLTGLLNRLGFERALAEACMPNTATGDGDTMAVLLCDLDGFKAVNDTYGHQAGDILLAEVAARLRSAAKPGTLVARLGGDEFGLLVRADRLDLAELETLAASLATAVSAPVSVETQVASVGVSIGLACYPNQGETPESLMRVADAAMYLNKRARVEATRPYRCANRHELEAVNPFQDKSARISAKLSSNAAAQAADA